MTKLIELRVQIDVARQFRWKYVHCNLLKKLQRSDYLLQRNFPLGQHLTKTTHVLGVTVHVSL